MQAADLSCRSTKATAPITCFWLLRRLVPGLPAVRVQLPGPGFDGGGKRFTAEDAEGAEEKQEFQAPDYKHEKRKWLIPESYGTYPGVRQWEWSDFLRTIGFLPVFLDGDLCVLRVLCGNI